MLLVLPPPNLEQKKGLPEEGRNTPVRPRPSFDHPFGNRAETHPKEGAFGSVFRSRKADDITQPPRYEQAYFR